MKIAGDRDLYVALTLLVLTVFYSIYFAKVLVQKQHGIQTKQIGCRKEKVIHTIEMLGDTIFLLSVLSMKDSWRVGIPDKDETELVTTGIYRFSRNPAFLSFDLMYIGVLLLYGNLLTLGFSVFAIIMLHLQILQEERYLVNTFGAPYQEYCSHVSRCLGRK